MALFGVPHAGDFPLLLAAGFCARLRHARDCGAYVACDTESGTLVRGGRDAAAVLHFAGCADGKRAAVRAGSQLYVELEAMAVLNSAAALLRVHVEAAGRGDVRVALQHPRHPRFLTLADVRPAQHARVVQRGELPDGADWFVLELVPPCPAAERIEREVPGSAVNAAQAVVRALLTLGIRFRLRSVHGRVLRRSVSDTEDAGAASDSKAAAPSGSAVKEDYDVVLQNGPKTQEGETHPAELVFEATRRGANFLLQEVSTTRFLSISPANGERAQRDGRPYSAALLVGLDDAAIAGTEASPAVLVAEGAPDTWGGVHLGSAVGGGESDDGGQSRVEWLMAGPRGRLETRAHKRAWEVLRVEFVVQSRDAVLRELPPSAVYVEAEKNTRAKARAEIVKEVAAARAPAPAKRGAQGGFDHAKALAGFSEPPTPKRLPAPDAATSTATKKGSPTSSGGASASSSGKDAAGKPGPVAVGAAAAGMSRTALNRKQTKREKRKQKRKAQAQAAASAAAKAGASSASEPGTSAAASARRSAAGVASDEKSSNAAAEEEKLAAAPLPSASSATAPSASGPPCAACGHAISGTYTTANGKSFHAPCFVCARCRMSLAGTGTFRSHKGAPHCRACYAAHVAPRCARCTQPIVDTVVTAMERTWHRDCLTCTLCRNPLSQTFWIYADKPREPRCADCVGMDPRASAGGGAGNRRLVNLPGFGPRGAGAGLAGSAPQAAPGGARMHLPVMRPPGGTR